MAGVTVVMMAVVVAQKPCADEIDDKADNSNCDGLAEIDRHRIEQSQYALPAHDQRDQRQHDRAGKAREIAELAGAEGEACIVRMSARVEIGERRDQHGADMGRHMPAIGEQRHRAVNRARADLDHHHDGGQRDDEPDTALIALMIGAQKNVAVAHFGGNAHDFTFSLFV